MRLPKRSGLLQLTALAVSAIIYFAVRSVPLAVKPAVDPSDIPVSSVVYRVVDGDTLKLSDGKRVRLIGVDTPEIHYSEKLLKDSARTGRGVRSIQALGLRASEYTKNLCENKPVKLEYDVKQRDRYERLLAYVYLEDGTFVNAKIVEDGYGMVMTVPPNVKHADYFLKLQKDARENRRGLWEK